MQQFGAATAEVMPKERGVVVIDYFRADVARVPRSPLILGFTSRYLEERYRSWGNRVTFCECAPSCSAVWWVVRLQFEGVAVCQCVWLVAGLRWLVKDEGVVIHTVVVVGLL